ncbi:MAG: amino acid ABC transporter substrate-binding protein [Selenomonadaceae bacterium]|nr:amino acid ABC transporter substrate-binding protein [Selenomonadaceae bacterium]
MKKFFYYALSLTLFAFFLFGCGSLNNQKKLVVGIDEEYAPMGFRNEQGELVGFDIDLAKETAKRMDVAIEFKPINWDNKIVELKTGNIDMIWNGLDITPERKKDILYSKPYLDNQQILSIRADGNLKIKSRKDLAGKIVGTQAGSTSETYIIRNEILQNSFAAFKVYDTFKTAFEALESGAIDVLICDEIVLRYEISKNPNKFKIIDMTIGDATEFGIGFRKNDIALRDRVQTAFDEIVADGTARKISEKWFGANLIKSNK